MESEQLLQEADRWLAELETKFPKRNFTATVVNLEGVSIFVTRYIKALQPPEAVVDGGDVSVSRMCNVNYQPFVYCCVISTLL